MAIKIIAIDHIVLRTTQIDKMINFYCNILSCSIERRQPDIKLVQVRAGDHLIDLLEVEHAISSENRNLEHFCLRIKPFDYETLKKYFEMHGVSVARYGRRYSAQGLGPSFYLMDPEENEVELVEDKS